MNHGPDVPAYGLWSLVIINSAIFLFFAFGFFKPRTTRDWRTFGTFRIGLPDRPRLKWLSTR